MFDVNKIKKRYFEIKIDGAQLDVEPPKLKALKKIISVTKCNKEDSIDNLVEAVKMILSKNKGKIDVDELVEEMDMDQLNLVLTKYFEWLNDNKNSKN